MKDQNKEQISDVKKELRSVWDMLDNLGTGGAAKAKKALSNREKQLKEQEKAQGI